MIRDTPSSGVPMGAGHPTYLPGLDGIRAVAVLAVVAYHLDLSWMPGGFLGVDTFMVLSGFLITRLLLREVSSTSTVDIRAFWVRRAKRLLPASLVLILTTVVVSTLLFEPTQLGGVRLDALSAIGYVANWRFVFVSQSYFDLFAEPSPFRHLWSLAIEEQFYLLWPLVVFSLRKRMRALVAVTAAALAASALLMATSVGSGDPSRAYYGTDTRAQTLLVGCLAAMLLQRRPLRQSTARPAALIAALLTIAAFATIGDDQLWMYRGGFLLFAVVAAVFVTSVAATPGLGATRVMESQPLVRVGAQSYSIYLWHWPVIVFVTEDRLGGPPQVVLIARVVLTFTLAWLSFRFVEAPIRRREFRPAAAARVVAPSMALAALVVVVVTWGAVRPPDFFSADGALAATPTVASDVAEEVPASAPRVLVVGDSVVASLESSLLTSAGASGLPLALAPVSGCGLLPGLTLDTTSQVPYEGSRPCPQMVDEAIENAFASFDPDVVVWLSIWDAENRLLADDRRIELETDSGRDALSTLIDARVREFEERGVDVVLVTVPVVAGTSTPEIKQERIESYDVVLREYANARPEVGLIDLASFICPSGVPCADLDPTGIRYRPGDGIHFEGDAVTGAATWLVEQMSAASGALDDG